MKTALKILTALAAVVGAVYVIATYGEKIVAWAKNLLASCPCCKCEKAEEVTEEEATEDAPTQEITEEAAEETAEEAPAEEPEVEVEIVIEENEPVAEEADFEA